MGGKSVLRKFFAVQGEFQELLRKLLKMLVLEHKHAANHTGDPKVALSNILSKAFSTSNPIEVLRSLKINYDLIYDRTQSPPIVRPSIDIDSFDSTLIFDILKSINGFPTCSTKSKQHRKTMKCSDPNHIDKCCNGCDHSCSFCNQTNCKKSCDGFGIEHQCKKCDEAKSLCKRNLITCCTNCQLCRHCGKKQLENLQCGTLKLYCGSNLAHYLRNLFAHLTEEKCQSFLDGHCKLNGFSSTTWDELSNEILDGAKKILTYMTDQRNFKIQPHFPKDDAESCTRRIQTIMESNLEFLHENFSDVLCSGYKDVERELSKELRERTFVELQELSKGQYTLKKGQDILQKGQDTIQKGQDTIQKGQEMIMQQNVYVKDGIDQITEQLKSMQARKNTNQIVNQTLEMENPNNLVIQEASDALKKSYLRKYSRANRDAAFRRSNSTSTFVLHDQIFVDVTLTNNNMSSGDVMADVKTYHEKNQFNLSDLITEPDQYTILNGAPGMGKTTLMKELARRWASGELLNGKNGSPKYDFVFLLFCRNFNQYVGKPIGIEKYIANEYLQVFDRLSVKDLRKENCKVLLVIEGFDECACYEEFQGMSDDFKNMSDQCQAIYNLLNPENTALPFDRLVTTRPLSRTLVNRFNRNVRMKSVEIFGFSQEQIKKYVENHFLESPKMARTVKEKLSESVQFQQLAERPVFCWAFCSLFKEDTSYNIPISITAIYASIILIFLRNHYIKRKAIPLNKLLGDQDTKTTLISLAEIAYQSLVKGNITFKEDTTVNVNFKQVVHQSGLIEKIDGSDLIEERFQFTHLSVQEFLAAFHIYLYNLYLTNTQFKENKIIFSTPSSLIFLAGFIGGQIIDSNSHVFTKMFSCVKTKETDVNSCMTLLISVENERRSHLYYEMLFEFQNPVGSLPKALKLVLPPTFNPLSSYRAICIKYLFWYIKNHNNNELPFKGIQLDEINLDHDIVSILRPYFKHLEVLVIMRCSVGFVSSILSDLTSIPIVTLPHCNVQLEEWRQFSTKVKNAYKKNTLRIEQFKVVDVEVFLVGHAFYHEHDAIVPDFIYKILPFFQDVVMQFNTNRIRTLKSGLSLKKSKLQKLGLILNNMDQFRELVKCVYKLPSSHSITVDLVIKCSHGKFSMTVEKKEGVGNVICQLCDICIGHINEVCKMIDRVPQGTFHCDIRFVNCCVIEKKDVYCEEIHHYSISFSRKC